MNRISIIIILIILAGGVLDLYAQAPDTLWTKQYSITPYFFRGRLYDIHYNTDEEYVVTGYIHNKSNQSVDATWMRIDTAGKVQSVAFYDYGGGGIASDIVYAVDQDSDGSYIFAGQSGNKVLLIKADSLGDTVWTRRFGVNTDQCIFAVVTASDSGFTVAGYTKIGTATAILIMKVSANGDSLWTRVYGGSDGDTAKAIVHTQDGGYVITGQREITGNNYDLYIIKVDANGDSVWAKHYGSVQRERGNSIVKTVDGGYLVAGVQYVTDLSDQMYLVRTDSVGDTLWTKSIGAASYDELYSAYALPNGEFIVGGTYYGMGFVAKLDSNGDTIWTNTSIQRICHSITVSNGESGVVATTGHTPFNGDSVGFVMRLNNVTGNLLSYNQIWGTERENAHSLFLCQDNGYIMAGWKRHLRDRCDFDLLLLKTDSDGDSLWAKTYGGRRSDIGYDVIQTSDNGYVIVGTTFSLGADRCDVCLLKTDVNGNEEWMRTYGEEEWDIGYAVLQTNDNGFIIVGQHYDSENDIYVIRTDLNGDTIWTRIYDNSNHEIGYDICNGTSGGFVIAGFRYIMPLVYNGALFMKINDSGDTLWTTTYQGAMVNAIIQASDNGYIAVGTKERAGMNEFTDLCLIKVDDNGAVQWTKTYGLCGSYCGYNEGHSIAMTQDGGYIAVGYSLYGEGIFVVRTDEYGDSIWTKVINDVGMESFIDNFTICQTQDEGYVIAGGNDWDWWPYHYGDHHTILVRLGPETGIEETSYEFQPRLLLSAKPSLFGNHVMIDYNLPTLDKSELKIYDVTGRLVKTFTVNNSDYQNSITWYGFNNNGFPVPSGMYFVTLRAGNQEVTRKIILMR